MAVIVKEDEKGVMTYRSMNGLAISSFEKEEAEILDQKINTSLRDLENELEKAGYPEKREKVEIYWGLGKLTNSLLSSAALPKAEVRYFFDNIKLRLPDLFVKKNRGSNRDHVKYCHRLGTYDKSTALALKWSEWVYLFDSSSIKSEIRFDKWFNNALKEDPNFFDRKNVRLIGKLLNNFFYKLETSDFLDKELERCYCEAKVMCTQFQNNSSEEIETKLSNLKKNRMLVAKIIDGRLSGQELYGLI